MAENQPIVPNPDPSVLTTASLLREISNSQSLSDSRISASERHVECIKEILETRLNAMDTAIELVRQSTERYPGQFTAALNQLEALQDQKFDSINIQFDSISTQFRERDVRTELTSKGAETAVNAALQAQKEAAGAQNASNTQAISKSEATFTKQIDQIVTLISTMQKSSDDKLDEVKSRFQALESDTKSRIQALESQKRGGNDVWGVVVAIIGTLIAAGILAMAVVAIFVKH